MEQSVKLNKNTEMRNKFILIIAFLMGQVSMSRAQSDISTASLDSLTGTIQRIVSDSELAHSYIGEIYLVVINLQKEQPVGLRMFKVTEDKLDTVEIKSKRLDSLKLKLANLRSQNATTLIAPFICLEDPKTGVKGNIMIYDIALNKLFRVLFKMTTEKGGCIILPASFGIKRNVVNTTM